MRITAVVPPFFRERCFTPAVWARLESLGQFKWITDLPKRGGDYTSLIRELSDTEVIVTSWGSPPITKQVIDACPKLKLIAHSAGSVSGVDIQAWKRGVIVTNVMPIMALGVGEFTITCILNGLRRFDALIKPELWDSLPFYKVPKVAFNLRSKTVGLVGFGIIGRQTLDLLRPFGCKVIVYDPYIKKEAVAGLGVELVDLDTLMKTSDVVSLHAPGTPATKNVISRERLEMLKPGAILVNTARGILIDHDALAEIAARGQIGVYLDVTYPEPLPPDHRLRKLPNVVLTPHVAGPTVEGWPMMGEACVADVEHVIKGESPKYAVTEQQYANQSTG